MIMENVSVYKTYSPKYVTQMLVLWRVIDVKEKF